VNRIFFGFVVLVMLSITAETLVIYFAINRRFGDPLEDIARRQALAQIFLLEQYVDKAPADEWLGRLNKVREVSEVPFYPLAERINHMAARIEGMLEAQRNRVHSVFSGRSTGSTAAATAPPAASGRGCRSSARQWRCTAARWWWRTRAWAARAS
jgi:hypothetical protein